MGEPPSTTLGDFLNRLYSQTSNISSVESPPESFRYLQKATQQLTLQDKMVEDKAGHDHSASECPMTLIINSFTILPPVKASQSRHPRVTSQLWREEAGPGRSASDGETAAAGSDGVTPAWESGGGVESQQSPPVVCIQHPHPQEMCHTLSTVRSSTLRHLPPGQTPQTGSPDQQCSQTTLD